MEATDIQRKKIAIDTRLSLLKKYLPDEKHVELSNAEGEVFKTQGNLSINFIPVGKDD